MLRDPGDLGAPRVRRDGGEVGPAGPDGPRGGLGEPQQQPQQRALPGSARPGEHDQLPRADGQAEPGQGREVAAGIGHGHPVQPYHGRAQVGNRRPGAALPWQRGVQDGEDAVRGGAALGAGVVLGGDGAQRQVGLGGEQQHQQRGLVRHVAVQQPQPGLDRDQGGGQGRGQLQHQRGQERHPQRGHGRGPVLLGDRGDHLLLGRGPAEHLQGGQALHHVEEVPGQLGQQPPLAARLRPGVQAHQGGEQRDQRQRDRDHHPGDPVHRGHRGQHGRRDQDRQHQLRQVPREPGIQPVQAPGGQGGDLAGLLPAEPGRAQPQAVPGQLAAQLRLDRRGGPQRRGLPAVGRGAPGRHHAGQQHQRPGQGRGPGAARGGGQRVGEQGRLRQDQPGHGQAGQHRDGQVAPGGPRMAQQPGVNRPHGTVEGSACRVVPGVPAGQQPVGFLGAPAAPGVRVDRDGVAEHRVDDLPGGLDGVLPGEQPPVPVQRRADQPVVRADVGPGLLREREVLGLRLPPGAGLLAVQGQADRRLRPDPEPQLVLGQDGLDPEHVAAAAP